MKWSRKIRALSLLIGVVLVIACTSVEGGARIETNSEPPTSGSIAGLLTPPTRPVATSGVPGQRRTLNIFMVHGMGDIPPNYWRPLFSNAPPIVANALPDTLNVAYNVATPTQFTLRGEGLNCDRDPCRPPMGQLFVTRFSAGDTDIRVYAYYWEAIGDYIEEQYTFGDRDEGGAVFNRGIKDLVMIDGFSDAALYLGPYGAVLREGIESALCLAASDATGAPMERYRETNPPACDIATFGGSQATVGPRLQSEEFAFVSFSLGSRMLFDALMPRPQIDAIQARIVNFPNVAEALMHMRPGCPRVVMEHSTAGDNWNAFEHDPLVAAAAQTIRNKNAIAGRVVQIHMLANQLPLLGEGALQVGSESSMSLRDGLYRLYVDPGASHSALSPASTFTPPTADPALNQVCAQDNAFAFFSCRRAERVRLEDCSGGENSDSVTALTPVQFTAFRDPSDLLGFRAIEHLSPDARRTARVIEIRHRNANVYLGLLAMPQEAHSTEDHRRQSLAIIWCGGEVLQNGSIHERRCGRLPQ